MLETKDLLKYPSSCTFGVIHEGTKTVMVYDTINFFKLIGEILHKLSIDEYDHVQLNKYKHELNIKIISDNTCLDTRRQLFSQELETLEKQGYTVLNKRKTLVRYQVKKVMTRYNKQSVVCVVKQNSRYEKTIMGIFNNHIEADTFIDSLGSLEVIPNIVAQNELTTQYLSSKLNIPLRI